HRASRRVALAARGLWRTGWGEEQVVVAAAGRGLLPLPPPGLRTGRNGGAEDVGHGSPPSTCCRSSTTRSMSCVTRLGDLERAVMQALWSAPAPLTGREVAAALSRPDLAYTTVLTVLTRLENKELVRRDSS